MDRNPSKDVVRVASLPADTASEEVDIKLPRGAKTIRLPFEEEEYARIVETGDEFRSKIDTCYEEHPELFPEGMKNGYYLHGFAAPSVKQDGLRLRRIKIKETGEVFSVSPSFLMPYMTARTEEVERALYLRQSGVPYPGLTYVSGRNDMFWYRLENSIGRNSIAGTTVRYGGEIPENIAADEKVTWFNGEEVNIAVTTGGDCVLGAAVCVERSAETLEEGYEVFKEEALNINPEYEPETVVTDGSDATRNAWKSLFSGVVLILCFLHSVLNIQKYCKSAGGLFTNIMNRAWRVYHAETKASFAQRIRRFKEWALNNVSSEIILKKILALCNKEDDFKKAYDHPDALRTSNMVDRIMNKEERYLRNMQYFHGNFISAELNVRSWAILHNFRPYSPRASPKGKDWTCAAENPNGFRYSGNWLENLLISSPMNGYHQ
jgi:hypothetical protein